MYIPQERVQHRRVDRGIPVPQIMGKSGGDLLVRDTMEQIVASSATDHGQIVKLIQLVRVTVEQIVVKVPQIAIFGAPVSDTGAGWCWYHPGVRLPG